MFPSVSDDSLRLEHPCDVCHQVMTPEEWEDRHWCHEEDCPRHAELTTSCTCDLEVHARCCQGCD